LPNKPRIAALVLGLFAAVAQAAGTLETPMLDPWVPPALRAKRAVESPAEGAALEAQVDRKLRAAFDAAAQPYGGTLTRDQARAAGFGFIANHFESIDTRGTGRVGFDDYRSYLHRQRGAASR
jgi:hypothetical protein